MDIISDLTELITEIFDAAAEFHEDLTRLDALETRLTKAGTSFVAKSLGKILEDADLFIMEAPHRKDLYNIQRKIARCLISCAGDVYYERTQVLNKADGTYHFLLDEMMKLPPDEHFTEGAEARILQDAAEASYSKAAERISTENQTVSKVTVMNKVHEILEELPLEEPAEKRCCSHLYIEADEDHIHRQDGVKELRGACIQGKLVYVFEGKESVREGRKELVNPFFFGGRYAGPEENARLWERVQEYILKNYDQSALKRVYISGDGGSWIRTGTDHIAKSVFVTDRFHLMKYINAAARQMLDDGDEVKGKIYKYIYKNKPGKLRKLFRRMKKSASVLDPVIACESFLENNWEAIRRAFTDKKVLGCSAEGHVSHIYSDRMSSRPMAWSETGADRMCRLRCFIKSCGASKVIDLVKARRERKQREHLPTGTDGIVISRETVRPKYTKAQLETAAYAEKLYAELSSTLTRKQISIRLHKSLW